MLPLWIIDLNQDLEARELFTSLLGGMCDYQRSIWHYTSIKAGHLDSLEEYNSILTPLIIEGRSWINGLESQASSASNYQICIIGDADQLFTRRLFHILPSLLKQSQGKIVANHQNRGIVVTGLLYVPSTLNQEDYLEKRQDCALFFEELNTLTRELPNQNFDQVVAYQDIQYVNTRFYKRLDISGRMELQFQILVHSFFVGHDSGTLFDFIPEKNGIFSIGTASVFYFNRMHKSDMAFRVIDGITAELTSEENYDVEYANDAVSALFPEEKIGPEIISTQLSSHCSGLDVDLNEVEGEHRPHPIWDMFKSKLYLEYYKHFLKFTPARLLQFVQSLNYMLVGRISRIIRSNRERITEQFCADIRETYSKLLVDKVNNFPTLAQLKSFYTQLKSTLEKYKKAYVTPEEDILPVPGYLETYYQESKEEAPSLQPNKILDDLKRILRSEPIVFSLAVRCFFLGLMLVFVCVPLVKILSPDVVDLGVMTANRWIFIPLVFLIPFLYQFMIRLRRHFLRVKKQKYRLMARTLLDININLASTHKEQTGLFYDSVLKECESMLEKICELMVSFPHSLSLDNGLTLPETSFNQPFITGSFEGEPLIKDISKTDADIDVNGNSKKVFELERKDFLNFLCFWFRDDNKFSKDLLYNQESFVRGVFEKVYSALMLTTSDKVSEVIIDQIRQDNVDLSPLFKMAGLNGMLVSSFERRRPVVMASSDALNLFFEDSDFRVKDCCMRHCTSPYVFYTCWQKLSRRGIDSKAVCNTDCIIPHAPALSMSFLLTMYFAFYKQGNPALNFAGTEVDDLNSSFKIIEKSFS